MLCLLFTFISPLSIALLLPSPSPEGLRQPLHLRKHRQPRHCPQYYCSFRYETFKNCQCLMCKPGQTLQCGGCWVAVGCHTTSIGKGDRLSHGNPYGPSACHAFYENWPSRWRSCPVFCSCEHKIKSGFLLCMEMCRLPYIGSFMYFPKLKYLPSSTFPLIFLPNPEVLQLQNK